MVKGKKEKQSLAQSMGITRTVVRPREESDIQLREDRIGRYFRKYLNKFVFVEFSDDFIKKSQFTYFTRDALGEVAGKIAAFARKEGLEAHARSALSRFEEV